MLRGQSDKQVTAPQVYHVHQKTANDPRIYHAIHKDKKEASTPKASQSKLSKKAEQDDELDESRLEEAEEDVDRPLNINEEDEKAGKSDDLDGSDLEEADEEVDDLEDDKEDGESGDLDESELEDAANQAVGALLGSLEDEAKEGESEDSELEGFGGTESEDDDATDGTSEEEEEDGKKKKSKMLRRQGDKKASDKVRGKAPHKNKSPHFKLGGQ